VAVALPASSDRLTDPVNAPPDTHANIGPSRMFSLRCSGKVPSPVLAT
jgi:hypothetical protein